MDYELMVNGNIKIGDKAPDFFANSTQGLVKLEDYKGKWVVFFSHPGDFTPVCTTEIIAFSKANQNFNDVNTYLLGLSVDSNNSHLAWLYDIYLKTGIKVPFPIIADRNGEIARKYGMISSNVSSTETVRNVIIIDNKGIVRAILVYPMEVGRFIYEILRIIIALQTSDNENVVLPVNWMPDSQRIMRPPQTFNELLEVSKNDKNENWYLRLTDK